MAAIRQAPHPGEFPRGGDAQAIDNYFRKAAAYLKEVADSNSRRLQRQVDNIEYIGKQAISLLGKNEFSSEELNGWLARCFDFLSSYDQTWGLTIQQRVELRETINAIGSACSISNVCDYT